MKWAMAGAGLAAAISAAWLTSGCSESKPSSSAAKPGEAAPLAGKTIELFIGSASKPAAEEAAALFEKKTGCKLLLHFGGSGSMLSQMKLARRGDIYFPGSSDYMELAKREKLVLPETEKLVVYLVPAINVPHGNPKNIQTLEDLAKPGIRLGIARPDTVCVGLYAVEVMVRNGMADRIKPNIVTHADSCEKTAQLVALGSVDAVLGWRVFQYWNPDKIQTILLKPEQVTRIGYISIAQGVFSKDAGAAGEFIRFILSDESKAIFRKWHYLTTEEEARPFAAPGAPVGGEWKLPEGW
jgi:molybdate transport system substrate-binding protein